MALEQCLALCQTAHEYIQEAQQYPDKKAENLSKAYDLYLQAGDVGDNQSALPYMGLAFVLHYYGEEVKSELLLKKALEIEPANRKIVRLQRELKKTTQIQTKSKLKTVKKLKRL